MSQSPVYPSQERQPISLTQITTPLRARARPLLLDLQARIPILAAVVLMLALAVPNTSSAGSATWSTTPASGDWNTELNWVPMAVPNGPADTATFNSSTQTVISLSADTQLNGMVFNAGASAYTIATPQTFELLVRGEGIANNSGITQNFVNSGATIFFNSATAGNLTAFTNHSLIDFLLNSTAAGSTLINNGLIRFFGHSTAGNSTITNTASAFTGDLRGYTELYGQENAGNGTFINNGSTVNGEAGGALILYGRNSTGAATVIANGGVNGGQGGTITFLGDSGNPGGTLQVKVFGNGSMDISLHSSLQVSVGSIEGDGNIFLGGRTLVVSRNNRHTTFSGVIQDGGLKSNPGGRIIKTGTGTLTLTGANTYTGATTILNVGRLLANNSSGSATGSGAVFVANFGSLLGGTGTIGGPVTVNAEAILLGGDPAAASGSLKLANNVTLNSGAIIQLVLGASGAHSTLNRTGGTWAFASNQAFSFINLGAEPGVYDNIITGLAGNPGGTASWTIINPGFAGTFRYDGAGNIDLTLTAAPMPTSSSLGNISTRLRVETGDNALIGGFIITGTAPKKVILRAIGPSLPFGDRLADPILELRNSIGQFVDWNNDWRDEQEEEIIATTIPPGNDLESAIVATLGANNAAYTATVRGGDNGTGIGLVEVYDLDQSVDSKLGNISTRGLVQTGDNALIGGVIVLGQNPLRVIVRAIGPSLPVPGPLGDPSLDLHDGNGSLIATNDNWRDDPFQEAEIISTGIPPSNDVESAIVRDLSPGNYTAIVRGVDNTTGVALVEVYGLN